VHLLGAEQQVHERQLEQRVDLLEAPVVTLGGQLARGLCGADGIDDGIH
jgi:hypothetical protein